MATKPLKVLMVTPNYAPELTGTGRYAGELAIGLVARGAQVEVICPPPHYPGWHVRAPYRAGRYQRETLNGVSVLRCPIYLKRDASGFARLATSLSFGLSAAPAILWRILASRPDTVINVEPTLATSPFALAAARMVGARAILHIQDLEVDAALAVGHLRIPSFVLRIAHVVERFLMRRFDRIVSISNSMLSAIERKGVDPARLSLIRNWVDIDRIRPMGEDNAYRREMGLEGRFVCLYSGQIGRKQALHLALEAATELADDPRFFFVIAGDGPERAPLVERYGGLSNVKFIPLQPEERLCELLNLADCHLLPQDAKMADLVLPSKLGGILASGKRVLVTAEPDMELAQFLGQSTMIVPPGDSHAIATGLQAMIGQADMTQTERLALAKSISATVMLDHFHKVVDRRSA